MIAPSGLGDRSGPQSINSVTAARSAILESYPDFTADTLCFNSGRTDKVSGKWTSLFNSNRTLVTNQSLVISPVQPSDAGFYQCEASNGVGNSISALIELQVHRKSFTFLQSSSHSAPPSSLFTDLLIA